MTPFSDYYSCHRLNCNNSDFSYFSHNCSRCDYENHYHISQSSHNSLDENENHSHHNYFASLIADHRLTDAIEVLEKRKIPKDWAIELLPLIQVEVAK